MRHEVHLHADIPILEGVSRRQLEQAFAPLLEYLTPTDSLDVKSLSPTSPASSSTRRSFSSPCAGRARSAAAPRRARSHAGCARAVLLRGGRGRSRSITTTASRNPSFSSSAPRRKRSTKRSAAAWSRTSRRSSGASSARSRSRRSAPSSTSFSTATGKASQQKKPERAFENYTRPSRKNLH